MAIVQSDTTRGIDMSTFFIHGGPGFNSKPEENLLANEFKNLDEKIHFWNEPSKKRGATTAVDFKSSLCDFEQFFERHSDFQNTLIAHSFGAFVALHLSPIILEKISKLILISPILDLRALDENIVSIAIQELKSLNNRDKAQELIQQQEKFINNYDLHRFNTTLNALVSVDLLSFYWFNKENMKNYQSYFKEEYEFDIANFQSIRMSILNEKISQMIKVPTFILFGEYDRISKKEDAETLIENHLPNRKIATIKNVAHYPHIEDPKTVFELIAKELKA